MDVAVDADDAGSLELVGLARAATVETEVEPVAGREREEVVGDGVIIRKLDRGADRNGQDVRDQQLAACGHLEDGGRLPRCLERALGLEPYEGLVDGGV